MNRHGQIQAIRNRLQDGGCSVGSWMQIPHASVAEIMGQAGYQWVALDLEHGAIGVQQLPDLCRALELGGTLPLARLAEASARDCKQALDAGAGGVILPLIESAAQLAALRDACRWPPAGRRGVGFSRANLFGKHFLAYGDEAQAPLLVAMIESARAVQELDSILQVPGLDALLIGPYDLSASMGLTARFEAPEFIATLAEVRSLATRRGIACGIHVVAAEPHQLHARLQEGYRFIAYSIDAVFLNSFAGCPGVTS